MCESLAEYIYTTSVPGAHGSQKRMWTPLELELHMVRGWKEGLVAKQTGYFSRGLGLNS